jgi:ABC-type transport system substrate-binding protein
MGRRLVTVVACVGLFAAGCTGVAKPSPSPSTGSPSPSGSPPVRGEALFGSEGWPRCLNPITDCALSDAAFTTVFEHVLPRAMEVNLNGLFVASPLLAEAPSLQNGGVTESPFTVTFRIRPEAVWDDGTSITSEDFAFTWRALLSTTGSVWTGQYRHVQSVDASDPSRAVIHLDEPYAPWPELFGGSRGFILKAAAFPDPANQPQPDLSATMAASIPFSGGPFLLKSWTDQQAELDRNTRYFGGIALLDRVRFEPAPDPPHGLQDVLSGVTDGISAGYDAFMLMADHQSSGCCLGVTGQGSRSMAAEIVWFDLSSPPLDDAWVRLALAHAIDRQAIVTELLRRMDPDAVVLNCGLMALPGVGPWCATQPFAQYDFDLAAARADLHNAGYDCSTAICTKGGKRLIVNYGLNGSSLLQNEVADLLKKQGRVAGIKLHLQSGGGVVFGPQPCPPTRFLGAVGCTRDVAVDPSVTGLVTCYSSPPGTVAAIEPNAIGWCNAAAASIAHQADRELDLNLRLQLMKRLYQLEADEVIALPLFAIPTLSIWRSDRLGGPIGTYSGTVYGMFFNMNEWYRPNP